MKKHTMATIIGFIIGVTIALGFIQAVQAAPRRIDGVVNLNTASADELQLLPGVGPAKAKLILDYRKARPFRTVDELVRVKGIGRKMVQRLRPHLATSGNTTATRPTAAAATPPVPHAVQAAATHHATN